MFLNILGIYFFRDIFLFVINDKFDNNIDLDSNEMPETRCYND